LAFQQLYRAAHQDRKPDAMQASVLPRELAFAVFAEHPLTLAVVAADADVGADEALVGSMAPAAGGGPEKPMLAWGWLTGVLGTD
jgi:hypothetical protein